MATENSAPYYLIRSDAVTWRSTAERRQNTVAKMVIASLLTDEPCTLRNVPLIGDL